MRLIQPHQFFVEIQSLQELVFVGHHGRHFNGLTRIGHNVVSINDRDVARYSNIFRSQKFGIKAMNERVLEMYKVYKPHMVMLGHCKNVTNETLAEIGASDKPMIYLFNKIFSLIFITD